MTGTRLRENATPAEEDEHLRADVDGQLGLGDEVGESALEAGDD